MTVTVEVSGATRYGLQLVGLDWLTTVGRFAYPSRVHSLASRSVEVSELRVEPPFLPTPLVSSVLAAAILVAFLFWPWAGIGFVVFPGDLLVRGAVSRRLVPTADLIDAVKSLAASSAARRTAGSYRARRQIHKLLWQATDDSLTEERAAEAAADALEELEELTGCRPASQHVRLKTARPTDLKK